MDAETDLISASRRLNAALISKGLLDQSNKLTFHEGPDARKIINFIYDIVQRRDKDSELKENLVNTIHEHKASEARLKKVITQLESKCDQFERQLSVVAIQRDKFSTNSKTLELQNRNLQDDIARQKTVHQQIRAQEANERRKRDQQILRMKEKAGFEIRKAKSVSTATGKLSNSSWSSDKYMGSSQSMRAFSEHPDSGSLFREQASNVMPDVIQELTDENARLVALIRETALTLNLFTGEKSVEDNEFDSVLQYLPSTFPELSIEINNSLEAMRDILHEPKYVAIEDLHQREQEIERLKKQLDTMTTNWKDAIQTMDEWNQYMDGKLVLPPTANLTQWQMPMDNDETSARDDKFQQNEKEDSKAMLLKAAPEDSNSNHVTNETAANIDNKYSQGSGKVSSIQDKENVSTPAPESSTLSSRIPVKQKIAKSTSASTTNYPWRMLSEITNETSHSSIYNQQGREQQDVVTRVKLDDKAPLLTPFSTVRAYDEEKANLVALDESQVIRELDTGTNVDKANTPPCPEGPPRYSLSGAHGANEHRIKSDDKEGDVDPLSPTVRQIIKEAGVTPSRKTFSGITGRTGLAPVTRTSLHFTSSPTVELSPIKLSSLESSATVKPSTLKRRRESAESITDNNYVGLSPVKLPKRLKWDD
ncbi:Afadin and alpha-actinin-binding-domain-containing protein [Lipomyces kononenkoae]|uniref:Afadin and alpha-actinin-binding-domain-containing protein n=1 Tax=Lipomyces kononenkoae TaxID=34357 RepID=A0ACC3TBH9_LIPKO